MYSVRSLSLLVSVCVVCFRVGGVFELVRSVFRLCFVRSFFLKFVMYVFSYFFSSTFMYSVRYFVVSSVLPFFRYFLLRYAYLYGLRWFLAS